MYGTSSRLGSFHSSPTNQPSRLAGTSKNYDYNTVDLNTNVIYRKVDYSTVVVVGWFSVTERCCCVNSNSSTKQRFEPWGLRDIVGWGDEEI